MREKRVGPVIENVLITDAGAEGKAVGHVNEKVVFLRNAVPGDIVDIQLTKQKKSYCEAKLLRVVKPSDKREEPFCSHFGICGGCKWQNMKYEHQLFYKQKLVEDNLIRIGKIEVGKFLPILPSPLTRHYRNKMEYSFSNVRYLTSEDMDTIPENLNMNALGFHVAPTYFRVLDLVHCYLPPDLSDRIRSEVRTYALSNNLEYFDMRNQNGYLRNMIVRSTTLNDCMLIMVFAFDHEESREAMLTHIAAKFPEITSLMYIINNKRNDTVSDLPVHLYKGQPFIYEQLEDIRFKIGPISFFQTNSIQTLRLYQLVREFSEIKSTDTVYDLYTGTGTIANFLARQAEKVVGIESIESAIENARENSEMNGITNTIFFAGEMNKVLIPEFIARNGHPNVLITDPPRAGMHEKVVEQIMQMQPTRIVYISCNPSTQARDAALLKEKYLVSKVQPVDMFPHTQHVESVMVMELKG